MCKVFLFLHSISIDFDENNYIKLLKNNDLDYIIPEIKKFKLLRDRLLKYSSYLLLNQGMNDYLGLKLSNLKILKSKYGKPYFENGPFFNISHSGNYSIVGISNENLGVDIEITEKTLNLSDFETCFNTNEDFENHFYNYWTAKEAILKCDGIGLNEEMINVYIDNNFQKGIYNQKEYYLKQEKVDNHLWCLSTLKEVDIETILI